MNNKEWLTMTDDVIPGYVPSPGEVIHSELEARGWSENDLAAKMGCSIETVRNIIYAKNNLTAEVAIGLGIAFDTSASFWLSLKKNYRLWLEKQES